MQRWEERKRQENQLERLKDKLKSKISELEEEKTMGERLRRRIQQLERENLAMLDRLANAQLSADADSQLRSQNDNLASEKVSVKCECPNNFLEPRVVCIRFVECSDSNCCQSENGK